MEALGKKLDGAGYDIPECIETPNGQEIRFQGVDLSEEKWNISINATEMVLHGTEGILRAIAKSNNLKLDFNSNHYGAPKSGIWWLDLLASGLEMCAGIAEKKAKEENSVERYEHEVSILLDKANTQINFYGQIRRRIEELIDVSEKIKVRCVGSLCLLESIIDKFDVNNEEHIMVYQKTSILIKGVSELSKVEILDSDSKLSEADCQYIVKSKQLLLSSL